MIVNVFGEGLFLAIDVMLGFCKSFTKGSLFSIRLYPGVPNQFNIVGPEMAHGTVAYKGLVAVHDASISFIATHWLSCTAPIWLWHGLAPLHEATHHALVRSLST